MKARKKRKQKRTFGVTAQMCEETLAQMESLKIYFECGEAALFELMIGKLYAETFYTGLSPLLETFLKNADKAHDEADTTSAETEKIPK